jgi:hypothetical protein
VTPSFYNLNLNLKFEAGSVINVLLQSDSEDCHEILGDFLTGNNSLLIGAFSGNQISPLKTCIDQLELQRVTSVRVPLIA